MTTPQELMEEAEEQSKEIREYALQAVYHFIDNKGSVYSFDEAIEEVEEELDIDTDLATQIVAHLASDDVDPVVHISIKDKRHIFVSEYVEGDWWYGYEEFDDVKHRGKKVVCCQCISEGKHPSEVGKVFEKDVVDEFYDYEDMSEWLFERHFQRRHNGIDPSEVGIHIGASLATGTTIASSTAWHDGNVTGGTDITVGATSVDHTDTSTQGSVDNSGTTGIQDVTLDGRGHVTGLTSADLAGAAGATTLIESQNPSGVSTADFTSSFPNHESHIFVIHNLIPVNDLVRLAIRTSTDGGTNWDSSAGNYGYATQQVNSGGGHQADGNAADAKMLLHDGNDQIGSGAGEPGYSGTVWIRGTGIAEHTFMTVEGSYVDSAATLWQVSGSGRREAAEDVTGVRFFFDSGNIESGTIEHLGVN